LAQAVMSMQQNVGKVVICI